MNFCINDRNRLYFESECFICKLCDYSSFCYRCHIFFLDKCSGMLYKNKCLGFKGGFERYCNYRFANFAFNNNQNIDVNSKKSLIFKENVTVYNPRIFFILETQLFRYVHVDLTVFLRYTILQLFPYQYTRYLVTSENSSLCGSFTNN